MLNYTTQISAGSAASPVLSSVWELTAVTAVDCDWLTLAYEGWPWAPLSNSWVQLIIWNHIWWECLHKRVSNFFLNGPDSKNVWLCNHLCCNYFTLPLLLKKQAYQYIFFNKWMCLSSNRMLFIKPGGRPAHCTFPTRYWHHENQQTLKIRAFFFRLLIVKHLPVHV